MRASTQKAKLHEQAAGIAAAFSTSGKPKAGRKKRKPVDPDLFEDGHASAEAAPLTVTGSMTLGELASVMQKDKPRKVERMDEDGWSARDVLSRPSSRTQPKRTPAQLAAFAIKKMHPKS